MSELADRLPEPRRGEWREFAELVRDRAALCDVLEENIRLTRGHLALPAAPSRLLPIHAR